MPTVIDSLVVLLKLDPTNFTQGQKDAMASLKKTEEAAEKHTKNIEAKAKMAAGGFKAMRTEVAGLFAVFAATAGIRAFVDHITKSDAAAVRLADNLGIGVERLSAWQKMAARFGGSAEDMSGAFRNVNRIIQDIRTKGSSDAITPLTKLLGGEGLAKFVADTTTVEERMRMVQAAIYRAPNRQSALTWAQEAGFTEATFTVMTEIGSKMDEVIAKQLQLNNVTRENAEAAKRMNAAWDVFSQTLEKVGRAAMYAMAPLVDRGVDWIKGLVDRSVGGDRIGAAGKGMWDMLTAGPGLIWDAATGNLGGKGSGVGAAPAAASTSAKATATAPRGIRNNNPGNLNFARQSGATLEDGPDARFAKFSTMADGVAALASQIQRYSAQGVDTVAKIIAKYAPPGENDTASYTRFTASKLGIGADDKIDVSNIDKLRQLMVAITNMEVGAGKLSTADLDAGLRQYSQRSGQGGAPNLSIGSVIVQTSGDGVKAGRDFVKGATDQYALVTQAGRGSR